MKTLFLFLLFSYTALSQTDLEITGDWLLPQKGEVAYPLHVFKIEPFSPPYYIGAFEAKDYALTLYKVRTFKVKRTLFLDITELNKEQDKHHYFWSIQKMFKDSVNLTFFINSPINVGSKDIISKGVLLTIDTSKINFDLVYSVSDMEYIAAENLWKSPSTKRQVLFLAQNPRLFEYLIRKYRNKIKGASLTYYRWSYFTWDKVNPLKSKDIVSITRLKRSEVHSIFETAAIDDLMPFKRGAIVEAEKTQKICSLLNQYHLVRDNSIGFEKAPNFWIIEFKDGSRIKVKTNLWERGLYDATNKKLYSSPERIPW
jgi:hypothetical protein